jgi:hypothetical protein
MSTDSLILSFENLISSGKLDSDLHGNISEIYSNFNTIGSHIAIFVNSYIENNRETNKFVFVLGSQDAEMSWIEKSLKRFGFNVAYAVDDNGRRIAPGAIGKFSNEENSNFVITVECKVQLPNGTIIPPIIDHHDPEDPRTNATIEQAYSCSSAGQVAFILAQFDGWTVRDTAEAIMVGESDHNLPAFASGRGITPIDIAREYIILTRHAMFGDGSSLDDFRAAIQKSEQTLNLYKNNSGWADLRGLDIDGPVVKSTGEQYPQSAQFLPVASSLCGIPYAAHIIRRDGKKSLRLGGFPENHQLLIDFSKDPMTMGCMSVDAPRPDNAYCFVMRGMGGGTLISQ